MKVEKSNHINFGMAWNKGSKSVLSTATAKLWTKKDDVISVINKLEHNSHFHELGYRDSAFYAKRNSIYGDNFYVKTGFRKGLHSLQKFILRQNDEIPKVEQLSHKLENALNRFGNDNIFDPGLRMSKEFLPDFTADLSKNLIRKQSAGNFEETVKLFDKIDDKAKATGATVTITPYHYSIRRIFFANENNSASVAKLKTFKKIDKRLDKLSDEIKQTMGMKDKLFKEDLKKAKYIDMQKKLISAIKNSKIYSIFTKIKDKIVEPFQKFQQVKARKLKSAEFEVAKKLDI